MVRTPLLTLATALLLVSPARADDHRTIAPVVSPRQQRLMSQVQERMLNRRVVRRPGAATRDRWVQLPGNAEHAARGKTVLQSLGALTRAGSVQRAIRKGHGSTDVQFKGKGIARQLGLTAGESITWNTRGAQHTLTVETASRTVLTTRPHDTYVSALRGAVERVVQSLAQDPRRTLTPREARVLATAPTDMRAEALSRHGLGLERVSSATDSTLKYKLTVPAQKIELFKKVFGPSVSTYLPGKGHSMYVHQGQTWETYPVHGSSDLRPTSRTIYPVMLTVTEAQNMDLLRAALNKDGWRGEKAQGPLLGHGRPAAWPPQPDQTQTGNTCTTTHHRAPVGQRSKDMAWIDRLQTSIAALARSGVLDPVKIPGSSDLPAWKRVLLSFKSRSNAASPLRDKPLLDVLTSTGPGARVALLDRIATTAGLSAEDHADIQRLKPLVRQYSSLIPDFPLQLLGRTPLKELMGVPHDHARLGTTDPLGPSMAKGMYSKAPRRVPVLVKLEKE